MTDILIRDVPDEVLAAIDAKANAWDCRAPSTCVARSNARAATMPDR